MVCNVEVFVNGLKEKEDDQKEKLKMICNGYEIYRKEFKDPIIKAKELIKEQQKEEECPYITSIDINSEYSEADKEEIRYEMKQIEHLPLWVKRIFHCSVMDHYTMFIASRYFEDINDLITLETAVRRFYGNL